jgi:hypothetical protein
MDKDKLKVIVAQLETLIEVLKSEVYSDTSLYYNTPEYNDHTPITDYDEIYSDDNSYPD